MIKRDIDFVWDVDFEELKKKKLIILYLTHILKILTNSLSVLNTQIYLDPTSRMCGNIFVGILMIYIHADKKIQDWLNKYLYIYPHV